ncbi:MAG: SCO family protein, partial [Dehalococcoidia bacterium]|nr:SCO family protein [Dehalococcoidia bacterium]
MRFLTLLVVALLAVVLVACGGDDRNQAPFEVSGPPKTVDENGSGDGATTAASSAGEAPRIAYRGARATPPLPKPDVVLTDTNGDPFDFLAQTEGYLTLLYLGYTHCPDICPTHLLELSKVLEAMDPELVERIRVVFITTDPERDDAAAIRRWLDLFDSSFIGLTIEPDTLSSLLTFLGMPQITKRDIGDGRYTVNHATFLIAYT